MGDLSTFKKAFGIPNQKEWGAGAGGLLAFAIIGAFRVTGHPLGDAVETALVVALPPIVAKLVPPSAQDVLRHVNDTIAQAGTILGKLTPASDSTAPVQPAAAALANKAS